MRNQRNNFWEGKSLLLAEVEPSASDRPAFSAQALGLEVMSLLSGGEQAMRRAAQSALGSARRIAPAGKLCWQALLAAAGLGSFSAVSSVSEGSWS